MPFEFSKSEASQIESLTQALQAKSVEVAEAVKVFNATVHEELSTLNTVIVEYNEILANARTIVTETYDNAQGEFDDKSERWQESDRGEAVQEWLQELNAIELDDAELYEVEPFDDFDPSHANDLEELPTEPNS